MLDLCAKAAPTGSFFLLKNKGAILSVAPLLHKSDEINTSYEGYNECEAVRGIYAPGVFPGIPGK